MRRGFTLIEVIVALAILVSGMFFLISLSTQNLKISKDISDAVLTAQAAQVECSKRFLNLDELTFENPLREKVSIEELGESSPDLESGVGSELGSSGSFPSLLKGFVVSHGSFQTNFICGSEGIKPEEIGTWMGISAGLGMEKIEEMKEMMGTGKKGKAE